VLRSERDVGVRVSRATVSGRGNSMCDGPALVTRGHALSARIAS
jgi:hypothetical protein